MLRLCICLAVTLSALLRPNVALSAPSPLERREADYADWRDAHHATDTIEAGTLNLIAGRSLSQWRQERDAARQRFLAPTAPTRGSLTPIDQRAIDLMTADIDTTGGGASLLSSGVGTSPGCSDRDAVTAEPALIRVLYDCFSAVGDHLQFEGHTIGRTTALELLHELAQPKDRAAVFRAFLPLWQAINGLQSDPESPYRRLIRLAAAHRLVEGDRIDAAAHTIGVSRQTVEQWLVSALEAWSRATAGAEVEPWDYWYVHTSATRALDERIPATAVATLSARFFHDLGADLARLGVLHDLGARDNKAPLSYTDYVRIGRQRASGWQPALVRVSATVEKGGLFVANEILHEDGHAVHMMALRTRPAFFDLGDAVFYEAFADVPSWSVAEPAFQRRYLHRSIDRSASYEALYSGVMLDIAWGLFELRLLDHPELEPNQLWTDITQRYLHVRPHPELAWWALRVQLVHEPGYMINYGLGAIITADLRAQITHAIGPFDAGNLRWYDWTCEHLLRFGESIDTPTVLRRFLGRPVSDRALRQALRHLRPTPQATSASVASKMAIASSISAAETTKGGMKRTVD